MFDVHLMISPVDRYIESYAMAGADIISFHPEAELHVLKTLQLIKSFNKKTGLALNPATSPDVIDYLMDFLDVIIVMTVNPGFGRQQFLSTQLRKIEAIRKKIDNSGCDIQLEVDGGITLQNAKKIISAGATILVAGTAVFSGDYQRNIEALRKAS
jgi:ribulose-phosphate 3-epimerase